jgi:hypothetical protein
LPNHSAAGLEPCSCAQDFVKLAKWEDRGHYALQQETEKSQRQLHKLVRDTQEVLKRPAAGVVGAVSAAMGFPDLTQTDLELPAKEKAPKKAKRKAPEAQPQQDWQDQVRSLIIQGSVSLSVFPVPMITPFA